jgi:hypothetical protein
LFNQVAATMSLLLLLAQRPILCAIAAHDCLHGLRIRHHDDTPYLLSSTSRNFVNCTAHVSIRCRYEEGEQLLVLIRDVVLPGGKGPYRESAQDNVRVKVRLAALKTSPKLNCLALG